MTTYPPAVVVGLNWAALDVHNDAFNTAARIGAPANLLKSLVNRESSGNWERDGSRPADVGRKKPDGSPNLLWPFVGIFQTTAAANGLDWAAMEGDKQAQVDGMAVILGGLAARYGSWDKAVVVYFGGPKALDEVFCDEHNMCSDVYSRQALTDWRALDILAGGAMPTPKVIDLGTAAGVAEYNALVGGNWSLSPPEVNDLLTSRVSFHTGKAEGICLHVQQGITKISVKDHASVARQASANAYVNLDGTIVLAVSRSFGAWTQGIKTTGPTASHPSPRGKAFLDRVGTTDANEAVLSIEAEGQSDGVHPPAQIDAIVWLCQEWMKANPQIGLDEIFKHADFDVVNRSYCPGAYYEEVMRRLGQPTPPPPAPSHPYPAGYDAAFCAAIWSAVDPALPPFNPDPRKGTVSGIWVKEGILSPIVAHKKEASGEEVFAYASGEAIGRYGSSEKFRVL